MLLYTEHINGSQKNIFLCTVQTRNMRPTQTQNARAFFAHTRF